MKSLVSELWIGTLVTYLHWNGQIVGICVQKIKANRCWCLWSWFRRFWQRCILRVGNLRNSYSYDVEGLWSSFQLLAEYAHLVSALFGQSYLIALLFNTLMVLSWGFKWKYLVNRPEFVYLLSFSLSVLFFHWIWHPFEISSSLLGTCHCHKTIIVQFRVSSI